MMLWESLHFKTRIKATCDYHNDVNKEIRFPISIILQGFLLISIRAVNKWECLYVLPFEGILRKVHTI